MAGSITHTGEVVQVSGAEVDVLIQAQSACGSCHAKSACGMSESAEKMLTVVTAEAFLYEVGETVQVSIEQNMGIKALFFAYMLPFLLIITILLLLLDVGASELQAGLTSLGGLVGYYVVLWVFRKRIAREIVFRIQKIDQ